MEFLDEYIKLVEERLYSFLPDFNQPQGRASKAAFHSLNAGGKRIRPVLALMFCEICGGDREKALDIACAVEYIHTFSLIHDDLPCMDDDDLRRGKPSCHKAFDEPTALLAGDALAVMPFGIIAQAAFDGKIKHETASKISRLLCDCVCINGMIGGQQIDIETEGKKTDNDTLLSMYMMKTSALLKAACCCGVLCAESENEAYYLEKASEYAENLGLAFQITDDILDVTSTDEVLGKPVGSDSESEKFTYVSLNGIDNSRLTAAEYTRKATEALGAFENNGKVMKLTKMLLDRKK